MQFEVGNHLAFVLVFFSKRICWLGKLRTVLQAAITLHTKWNEFHSYVWANEDVRFQQFSHVVFITTHKTEILKKVIVNKRISKHKLDWQIKLPNLNLILSFFINWWFWLNAFHLCKQLGFQSTSSTKNLFWITLKSKQQMKLAGGTVKDVLNFYKSNN